MKNIKFSLPILLTLFFSLTVSASTSETLKYVISYKWGMIHKEAADATLTMRQDGDKSLLTLTAKTRSWADKFFMVRDTLRSETIGPKFLPLVYTKTAHEGGAYAHDVIRFKRAGSAVSATCRKIRVNKKGERKESTFELKSEGDVFDMLSVFYYLRHIDYVTLQRGTPQSVTIFSGSDKAETVRIRFEKEETIELKNKIKRKAYLLKFGFTSKGHKKSSEDIRVWVSADGQHIPLLLVGKLPVGEVRVTLQ